MAENLAELMQEYDDWNRARRGVWVNNRRVPFINPDWFLIGQHWHLFGYRFWVHKRETWINREGRDRQRVEIEFRRMEPKA